MRSLALGAIALGLYFSISSGFKLWGQYQLAHEFEYGTIPTWPSLDEWDALMRVALAIMLPFFVAAMVMLVSFWITKEILFRRLKHYLFWVACYQGRIIGRAVAIAKPSYTLLTILYIEPEHRGQRVGSHLLWHCLQQVNRPVYLICHRQLQSFYRRLGFATVPGLSLPSELNVSLPPIAKAMKLSLSPQVPAPIIYLPFAPSYKWSVQLLTTWREKWRVYRTLGKRKRFRQARRHRWGQLVAMVITPFLGINVLVGILKQIPGLTGLRRFDVPFLGLYVSSFALAALLITLLLGFLWMTLGRQEWVVNDGKRAIAYVQFSTYAHCAVLHQLHVEPQYPRLQMAQLLLGYFSRKVQFPIYAVCQKRDRPFFAKLGFTRIPLKQLPFEMKLFKGGNTIPVKITHETATTFYKFS